MKGKQLFLLLVLAALAVGGWYFLTQRNHTWSETGGGGGKVVDFPINDVAHLKIKNTTGELNLVKKGDDWVVQERADYPANFEQVSSVLRKLWELKTVQEVKVGASQLSRLDLDEPGKGDKTGTLVEFIGADGKTLAGLVLGKAHTRKSEGGMGEGGFPTGRYVKAVTGTKVSLVSDPLADVEPNPEKWLAKDFVKIDGPKSIAVAGPTDAQKWTVTRENATAEWKLADAKPDEKVDAGKTSALGSIFSSPAIDDVLAPDAKPAETGLDKPTVATIETFDGFTYTLKIGKPNGKDTPVQVSVSASLAKERTPGKDEKPEEKTKLDEEFKTKQKRLEEKLANEQKLAGRAYLVPQFAVEALLKDRTALLVEKPTAPAPVPAPAPAPMPAPAPVPVPAPASPDAARPMPKPPADPAPKPAEDPASKPVPSPTTPPAPPAPPVVPEGAKPVPPEPPASPIPAPASKPPTQPAPASAPESAAKPTPDAPAKPASESTPSPAPEAPAKPATDATPKP